MSVERFDSVLVRGSVWRKPDPDGFTEINVAPVGRGPVDVLLPPESFTTEAAIRADERAKIVKWLRSETVVQSGTLACSDDYANAIERGEYVDD